MQLLSKFQITDWVDFDKNGRANCPCCGPAHGSKDKSLSLVPGTDGAYKCHRGCTPAEIRAALGEASDFQPRERSRTSLAPPPPPSYYTYSAKQVRRSVERLFNNEGEPQQKALFWLLQRGISPEMARHYRLGLEKRVIIPDESKPHQKKEYSCIALFIPVPNQPGRFYVKKRVAPWLTGHARPDYLDKWTQFGVPATVWFTYKPNDARETWFCEGEWDAIVLGWLAQLSKAKVAVACSTAGCGSVPKSEELARLPGRVTIFYDRNDSPDRNGRIPGDEGALKLAEALLHRGFIGKVPMPDDCTVKGWDVSNAIDAGFTWEDFEEAARKPEQLERDDQDKGKVITYPAWTPLTPDELRSFINNLIEQGLPDSEISLFVPNLAKRANYSESATWKIYHNRLKEIELEENRAQTAALVDLLLKARLASVPLHSVLPLALAEPLTHYASWLNVRPEVILLTFLTAVSGLHHTATTSWLNRDWDFEVKPNLFTAIVAPPSQKKSPILKAIAKKPLRVLERKARDEWKTATADYRTTEQHYNSLSKEQKEQEFPEGLPSPPPDRRKVHSFSDATTEGLRNQIEAYPEQGLIGLPDELARLLKSANKYRGGKGSDEEDLLSYYDGGGETVLRADGLAGDFDNLLLAILGSIQPGVLQKMIKDCQDENGKWARFQFVIQPLAPSVMNADGGSFDLTPMLADLYEKVNKLPPQDYKPEREAFTYYCSIYNEFERRRCSESHPGLSAAWGKAEGRVGKLACNLHVIHELMTSRTPSEFIPKARYEEAFAIAMFGMQQVFSLYNELGEQDALANHLLKVLTLSQDKGAIVARDVQLLYDSKSRPTPDVVRSWFRELEAMGKGKTEGMGRYLSFRVTSDRASYAGGNLRHPASVNVENVESKVENHSTFESFINQGVQPNVEKVEKVELFEEKNNHSVSLQNTVEVEIKKLEIFSTNSTNSTFAANAEMADVSIVESTSTEGSTFDPDPDDDPDPPRGGRLIESEREKVEASAITEQPNFFSKASGTESALIPATAGEEVALAKETDPWLREENLQEMAQALEDNCPDIETLAALRPCWPAYAMNAACKRLSPQKHAQIKQWVVCLNQMAQEPQYRYGGKQPVSGAVEIRGVHRSQVKAIEPGQTVVACEALHSQHPALVYVKPVSGAENWLGGVAVRREDLQPLD